MKLVFATHNKNKFKEVKLVVPKQITLLSLNDIGCTTEIPEIGETLEENAISKADYVTQNYGYPCFADDTGLHVNALNGAPGVYSARYAGEEKNSEKNIEKVLSKLKGRTSRSAEFRTVIALNLEDGQHVFQGMVKGEITLKKYGKQGFGYDPIFTPLGYNKTFAELPIKVKNKISHRGQAIEQLLLHLGQM